MIGTARSGDGLFEGGPPRRLQTVLGLHLHAPRKAAAAAAAIGWLPLAVLSAGQSFLVTQDVLSSFLWDFAVHVRCLLTVPLFILAEGAIAPRLGAIAQHFLDAGLVTSPDRVRFEAAVASTRRLRDSLIVELAIISLAAALLALLAFSTPSTEFPRWQRSGASEALAYSPAGWWHLVVSLPLLLILFLGWMWRLCLWARFLWLMSRLDLHLVPAHPDRAAGLMFIAQSLRPCSLLGLALGTIVAGTAANGVIHGQSPLTYKYVIAGVVVLVVLLFSGPLMVFTGKLIRQRQRGVFEYGALAADVGQRFEHKWLGRIDDQALKAPDFSATIDLYTVVANVYQMRLVAADLKSILLVAMVTLLPFVPVLLMAMPLKTVLKHLAQLLF